MSLIGRFLHNVPVAWKMQDRFTLAIKSFLSVLWVIFLHGAAFQRRRWSKHATRWTCCIAAPVVPRLNQDSEVCFRQGSTRNNVRHLDSSELKLEVCPNKKPKPRDSIKLSESLCKLRDLGPSPLVGYKAHPATLSQLPSLALRNDMSQISAKYMVWKSGKICKKMQFN